jgi:hypothetical protein
LIVSDPIGYGTEHEGFIDGYEIEEALIGYENCEVRETEIKTFCFPLFMVHSRRKKNTVLFVSCHPFSCGH